MKFMKNIKNESRENNKMNLQVQMHTDEQTLNVPEVVVPGLTTCGSSACSSTCSVKLA